MRCENCQGSNSLTAETYHARTEDGMTGCANCKRDFNFGPRVIDLRDEDDEALNASKVPQLVWYHTTTEPEWPQVSRVLPDEELRHLRETAHWPEDEMARHRRFYENQALHVGTYEAAIESMLRHMTGQNDRNSAFYLYRLRLRQDVSIAPELRDENHEQAAKITRMDLAAQNWDAIRYLNAYESMGSISLALVRSAIAATQRICLPVPELVGEPHCSIVEQVGAFRKEVQDIRAENAGKPLTTLDNMRMRASGRPGGPPPPEPNEVYPVLSAMECFVADQYLGRVSPIVRYDFLNALGRPHPADDEESYLAWLTRFMNLATLLTSPGEVLKALDAQPWQEIQLAKQ
jgi:hypothetical protein